MKQQRLTIIAVVAVVAPAALALQAKPPIEPPPTPKRIAEWAGVYVSDFAPPRLWPAFVLLKKGSKQEAATLFRKELESADPDPTATVGLAQAEPEQWEAQIKELSVARDKSDLQRFRLATLLCYHANSKYYDGRSDLVSFDKAAEIASDLWTKKKMPLAGLLLVVMSKQSHRGWKAPNRIAILEELIRHYGGSGVWTYYQNARDSHFNVRPPTNDAVKPENRHSLAGVLIPLWCIASEVYRHTIISKKGAQTKVPVWVTEPMAKDKAACLKFLDTWINQLYPRPPERRL